MTTSPLFSRRSLFWLITVGTLSFCAAVGMRVLGPDARIHGSTGANTYSYSAIGHRAFHDVLQALDIPVLVSRNNTIAKAGDNALVIAAEPILTKDLRGHFTALMEARRLLVVLPKRRGIPSSENRSWIERTELLPEATADMVLQQISAAATVVRVRGPVAWQGANQPVIDNIQLIRHGTVQPIIAADEGVFLGLVSRGDTRHWILSDPDILSNAGLGNGDNGAIAAIIVAAMLGTDGAVIFDETVHGFWQEPNLWRAAFTFPMILITLNVAALVGCLVWSATGRFGSPIPVPQGRTPGQLALVETAAGLLQYGGHGRTIWHRYSSAVLRAVAAALHAPRNLDETQRIAWLSRVSKARGIAMPVHLFGTSSTTSPLRRGPGPARLLSAARELFVWKQEILHGAGRRTRN